MANKLLDGIKVFYWQWLLKAGRSVSKVALPGPALLVASFPPLKAYSDFSFLSQGPLLLFLSFGLLGSM